ncbi:MULTISPECIES: hypothetical protein [Borrelia]|uniref:Uncharacterized conserved protein n=2 Tax=Borrelia TaxID=138 RepID=B5RMQ2_BORDL|nr:hypothetical protein [Borrelia recurrentis]ACH93638.1 uncharacterized conserved protein [Borrelia duttonii Ly]ACH94932.1 uncharacterized conserved protein [Borrelia recurrentis A1]
MKNYKSNDLIKLSSLLIRVLVIVLFLNSILSFFMFLAGAYNIFMHSFQKFSLEFTIVLSSVSFGLEITRAIFFYVFRGRKFKHCVILILSFVICFCSFFIKVFLD